MGKELKNSQKISPLNLRLTKLLKEKGWTINTLAERAGIAAGTVQKLLTDSKCNPTISSLQALAEAFDTTLVHILGWHSAVQTSVPILNWENIKIEKNKIVIFDDRSNAEDFITLDKKVSTDVFALKVKDNAMMPLFPESSVLIFDPYKESYDRAYVLVKLGNYEKIVFKQLFKDEPHTYIKSVSTDLRDAELIKLTSKDLVIATLIECRLEY